MELLQNLQKYSKYSKIELLIKYQKQFCKIIQKKYSSLKDKDPITFNQFFQYLVQNVFKPLAEIKEDSYEHSCLAYYYKLEKISESMLQLLKLKKQQSSFQKINQSIFKIFQGKVKVPDPCLKCQSLYSQGWYINKPFNVKLFTIENYIENDQGDKKILSHSICSALNTSWGHALILIGVTKQRMIKGVRLNKENAANLPKIVQKIRGQIFPPPLRQGNQLGSQIIEVQLKKMEDYNEQPLNQLYIIKIYVRRNMNKVYFIQEKQIQNQSAKSKFTLILDPNNKFEQQKITQQIYKSFKFKTIKNLHHNSIKCAKQKKKKSLDQFGLSPISSYKHEYLIILNEQFKKIDQLFLKLKMGGPCFFYEIYANVKKSLKVKPKIKRIYYLAFKEKYQKIKQILREFSKESIEQIKMVKIHPQFRLYREQPQYEKCAKQILEEFDQYITQPEIKFSHPTKYFYFKNKQQIFAFICLYLSGIKVKFEQKILSNQQAKLQKNQIIKK